MTSNYDTGSVWRMFDSVADRYDLLNRLLSFRRDVVWRNKLVARLPVDGPLSVLDVATGTGDVLATVARLRQNVRLGLGLDMSPKMLALARAKLVSQAGEGTFELVRGDAARLPVADRSVDAVTMAFGIRNVPDVPAALEEVRRVLKPGGRALLLEFSLPANRVFRPLYLFYLRHVLPWLGGVVSRQRNAYQYLNETIESFPYGQAFCDLLLEAGFDEATPTPLTLGIATLYTAL